MKPRSSTVSPSSSTGPPRRSLPTRLRLSSVPTPTRAFAELEGSCEGEWLRVARPFDGMMTPMTGPFRHLPIRLKLIAMIMTASGAVLVLASLGYLLIVDYQTRGQLEQDLRAQADLIVQNIVAALQFADERIALTLDTLSSKRNIRLACLYNRSHRLLAGSRYGAGSGGCPPESPPAGARFGSESVPLTSPGARAGRDLRRAAAALGPRGARPARTVPAGGGLAAPGVRAGVAVLLSSRLQRVVSDPVMALANTASEVSRGRLLAACRQMDRRRGG